MGRCKDKYRIRRDVYVTWALLESEAFKTLSATGIRVLLRFFQKRTWAKTRKKKVIYDNGGLAFTYAEAKELGISTSQFHTVLNKLHEVGFIDIEHQGGGLARDYSRYAISDRWTDYGTDSFKSVKKHRVLWTGHDVRANMKRKKATGKRSCQLRKTVVIDENNNAQGAGKP